MRSGSSPVALSPTRQKDGHLVRVPVDTSITKGPVMEDYLGVPGIKAEHMTMVLKGCDPYFDIQLLRYIKPEPTQNEHVRDLTTIGFNHLCFAVEVLDETLAKLTAAGVKVRNKGIEFRDYKMTFIWGPEGVTLELVEKLN